MPTETQERPRIFLSKVHLKGFKSIDDLTIDFRNELNILIGKNGSGKSNFLEFLFHALRVGLDSKMSYNYAKLEFTASDGYLFSMESERKINGNIGKDDIDNRIVLVEKFSIDNEIMYDNSDGVSYKAFKFKDKIVNYGGRSRSRSIFLQLGYPTTHSSYVKFSLPDNLECIDVPGTLKIHLEKSFTTWNYPDTLDFIDNLFFYIELSYNDDLHKTKAIDKATFYDQLTLPINIVENLKRFTNIEDIKFNSNLNIYSDDKTLIIDNIKIDFKINGNWLPWSQLSDGTKRLFYIVSEVTYSDGIILIEEPELGVHPHQFNLLMNFLKEQSGDKQIIISTHSPKALDHLSPQELGNILIANYDLKKGTQIRHLTSSETNKAKKYIKEVGFFSDYWMLSDLE